MTNQSISIGTLAYALLGVSPLVAIEEVKNLQWRTGNKLLSVDFELASGEIITVNVGGEGSGATLANVVMTAFDLAQQELAESDLSWGEARPACLPGHAHPATCSEVGNSVVLACPLDYAVIRVLATIELH
jgi:hypothetical protein